MLDVTISLQSSLQMQAVLLSSQATASVGWRWAITLNIPLRFHATLDAIQSSRSKEQGNNMDDTITLIATQNGQAFTDTIKLLDVQLMADVLVAELRMDDIFTPIEVHVDLQSSLSSDYDSYATAMSIRNSS